MRYVVFLLALALFSCKGPGGDHYNGIAALISQKNFFQAREDFEQHRQQLSAVEQLKTGAFLDNAFNKLAASNEKISLLFERHGKELTDSNRYQLLHLKQMNHAKLYEYREADTTIGELLAGYRRLLKKEDQEDFENTRIIWRALSGQPKQTVTLTHGVEIKMKRDKLGLLNLTVTTDTSASDFIFDTGANISTTTETTARKLGMQFMEGTVEVHAITGLAVPARIALSPGLNIHGIIVRNAAFLVFPDSALAIPQIPFQINGIIGFPVIEALKEIQITKAGSLIVPAKRTVHARQNMALDFLTPILQLQQEYFTFDTGADGTILYPKYYRQHKDSIEGKYKETEIRFAGAGGPVTKKGFKIPVTLDVDGRKIMLDSVQVLKEELADDKKDVFGNIGQDLIGRFGKMTLNFEAMFIKFD